MSTPCFSDFTNETDSRKKPFKSSLVIDHNFFRKLTRQTEKEEKSSTPLPPRPLIRAARARDGRAFLDGPPPQLTSPSSHEPMHARAAMAGLQ
ncbi:hypothetical protein AVEN_173030-1 [Araneus ventricosus]|uniref:Uncharacterized protein n=1 Tax=Araneus ventricosus TaxID=182803 RepID=A0A4Y2LQ67_ARAVE|nr:hypothetical protein AVEN_173030-1 [Araneus ventricosus]